MLLPGGALGLLLAAIGFPLPWLMGAMIATAAASLAGHGPHVPGPARGLGQLIVSSAVAANLDTRSFDAIHANIVPILIVPVLLVLVSGALARLLMWKSRCDEATALFAVLPGGAVEMAELGRRHGGSGQIVAAAQTLRVAAIVTVVPTLLLLQGVEVRGVLSMAPRIDPLGLALVFAVAVVAAVGSHRLRLSNAFFVGPLAAVGAANALGMPVSPVPGPLIVLAQMLLGAALGSMFTRGAFSSAPGMMRYLTAIAALTVAFGLGLAAILSWWRAEDFAMLALATAPGSITELSMAAKAMSLDAVVVTAYHIVRIFVIVMSADLIFAAFRLILRGRGGGRDHP